MNFLKIRASNYKFFDTQKQLTAAQSRPMERRVFQHSNAQAFWDIILDTQKLKRHDEFLENSDVQWWISWKLKHHDEFLERSSVKLWISRHKSSGLLWRIFWHSKAQASIVEFLNTLKYRRSIDNFCHSKALTHKE